MHDMADDIDGLKHKISSILDEFEFGSQKNLRLNKQTITFKGQIGVFTFRWTRLKLFVFSHKTGFRGQEVSGEAKGAVEKPLWQG